MKIIKVMQEIFAIKGNNKEEKKNDVQMMNICNDIYHKVNENGNKWETITIAKDKNNKLYWFTHRKNQNIPQLMYYHNATEVMTWKNN